MPLHSYPFRFGRLRVSRNLVRAIDEQLEINGMLEFPEKYIEAIPQLRAVTADGVYTFSLLKFNLCFALGYLDLRSLKLSNWICSRLPFKENEWQNAITIDLSDNHGVTRIPHSFSKLNGEITKSIIFTVDGAWDDEEAQIAKSGIASEIIAFASLRREKRKRKKEKERKKREKEKEREKGRSGERERLMDDQKEWDSVGVCDVDSGSVEMSEVSLL